MATAQVVHFEIPAEDLERAKEFYRSTFGWQLDTMDMGGAGQYTSVRTTPVGENQMPTEPGAINGGMMQRTADTPSPVITIAVESIDASLKDIESGGGSTIQPRTEIPDMGAFAYFRDPEGNVMGLWENAT
jgi:predicted enzyme related to lactoylglutathione lyase